MLQACLNGNRSPREHHHLPVSAQELAHAAAATVLAGAEELHLHPKSPDGTDSLDPSIVATTLNAVRAAVPGTPVGTTTGAWTAPDAKTRVAAIRDWTVLPDHASVNWHEPGAEDVATALLKRGIDVEAGLWSGTSGTDDFARSPLRLRVFRILAEVTDPTSTGAVHTAQALLTRFGTSAPAPVLLHGQGAGAWPVLELAHRRGLDTRIGFEDTLQLPDGEIASDNAALITVALQQYRLHTGG